LSLIALPNSIDVIFVLSFAPFFLLQVPTNIHFSTKLADLLSARKVFLSIAPSSPSSSSSPSTSGSTSIDRKDEKSSTSPSQGDSKAAKIQAANEIAKAVLDELTSEEKLNSKVRLPFSPLTLADFCSAFLSS
jgi:hypothetical protein